MREGQQGINQPGMEVAVGQVSLKMIMMMMMMIIMMMSVKEDGDHDDDDDGNNDDDDPPVQSLFFDTHIHLVICWTSIASHTTHF